MWQDDFITIEPNENGENRWILFANENDIIVYEDKEKNIRATIIDPRQDPGELAEKLIECFFRFSVIS